MSSTTKIGIKCQKNYQTKKKDMQNHSFHLVLCEAKDNATNSLRSVIEEGIEKDTEIELELSKEQEDTSSKCIACCKHDAKYD